MLLSYDDWREQQVQRAEQTETLIRCPECEGTKERPCGECDNMTDCDFCDETAQVNYTALPVHEQARCFKKDEFRDALMADARKLAGYTGRPIHELLFESGFAVLSTVRGRHIGVQL